MTLPAASLYSKDTNTSEERSVMQASIDEARDDVRVREISRLIERRADATPDPDELEESYMESVRRHRARRRRELQAAWYCYFCRLADSLRSRAAEYDERALKLLEDDKQS